MENEFHLRTKEEYNKRCESRDSISEAEKTHYSKVYGINQKSILNELPGFDVTQQLPQDLMHVLLEGIFPLHLEQFLHYVIEDAGLMTLGQINSRIAEFPYAYFSDKPGPLSGFDPQGTQTGTWHARNTLYHNHNAIILQLFRCGNYLIYFHSLLTEAYL